MNTQLAPTWSARLASSAVVRLASAVALAALLLALPASASAAATQLLRSTSRSLASPALAGDSVVVDSYGRNVMDLLVAAPGQPTQRLLHQSGSAGLLPAATPGRVLLRRNFESGASDLLGGPLAGPISTLETCPQEAQLSFPAAPAIDGDLSVWSAAGCVPDSVRVQLGAASHTLDAGGYVLALAAAGRYAAWLANQPSGVRQVPDTTRLTVYDAQAGQVAYSLRVEQRDTLDLDADGTAILGAGAQSPCTRSPGRLFYYTLAEPVPHELPFRTCSDDVRIAAGRIAFVQRIANANSALALSDLGGSTPRELARFDEPRAGIGGFDFDGARVAWTQTRCLDAVLLRRDVSDTSPPEPAVTCPLRVGTPRLGRDGTLHVPVSCPHGCRPDPGATQEGIQVVAPHWLHVWRKTRRGTRYAPFVRVSLPVGGHTTVHLPLTTSQRATLRRHGRVRIRLKVVLQDIYLPRILRTAAAT